MALKKVINVEDAVAIVHDNDVVATTGYGGNGTPDPLLENLALAMAAKNPGGYVICQVERIAAEGSLDSREVRIPGIFVDCVVLAEAEHHMQTYGTQYNPAFSGEVRIPLNALKPLPLAKRKVSSRQITLLGTLFTAQAVVIFSAIGYFAGYLGELFRRNPAVASWLDRVAGGVFILLGLRLIAAR